MYAKGKGAVSAKYACGGPVVTSKSRFMKAPDVYRGDKDKRDYGSKKDPLADESGDSKSLTPIKPHK